MSKFIAGVIGWGLSIVWTGLVFVGGILFYAAMEDYSKDKKYGNGALHEV